MFRGKGGESLSEGGGEWLSGQVAERGHMWACGCMRVAENSGGDDSSSGSGGDGEGGEGFDAQTMSIWRWISAVRSGSASEAASGMAPFSQYGYACAPGQSDLPVPPIHFELLTRAFRPSHRPPIPASRRGGVG